MKLIITQARKAPTRVAQLALSFLMLTTLNQQAAQLTFYIKPFPLEINTAERDHLISKLRSSNYGAKQDVRRVLGQPIQEGIFSLYAGYVNVSNEDGQISFPRKHTSNNVTVIITPHISPIVMENNTLHHWLLEKNTPADVFTLERKKDDETGIFFWDTIKGTRPEGGIIPKESIVIFAKPGSIHIPIGITLTTENENIILPDFYIKKGTNVAENGLYMLKFKHFFAEVSSLYKKGTKGYASNLNL